MNKAIGFVIIFAITALTFNYTTDIVTHLLSGFMAGWSGVYAIINLCRISD